MQNTERYLVYDLETLNNLFTACFKDHSSGKKKQFIIHKSRNDYEALMAFLYSVREDYYMVGFNNVEFDGQIINFLYAGHDRFKGLSGDELARVIKAKSSELINAQEKERWLVCVPEQQLSHKQIDLYKQKHYDGKAKKTSLKWLEFTMRMQNIEEMPLPHDAEVMDDQIDGILSYNWNDVEATHEFFIRNKFETDLRLKLSDNFHLPLLNASEPRMAREILAKLLAEDAGKTVKEVKDGRTYRKEIHLGKCIIPRISFEGDEFAKLVASIKKTTINPEVGTKDVFNYSMNYKGIDIDYGVGGVHGTCGSGIYTSDDEWVIKTVDVKSFYPNMIINYGFVPAHLGQTFANRYKWFYTERTKYDKKDPTNYVFKIILNGTYGMSNDKFSFLYDTLVTMKTTINGQLLLSMLAESLSGIPDSQLIMMNTDGLEIRMQRKYEQEFVNRCRVWENLTNLELEYDEYQKIILSDVNNYIGIFGRRKAKSEEDWLKLKKDEPLYVFEKEEGSGSFYYYPTKLKGRYEIKMEWHKNPSAMIITKAVYNYFVLGTPVEESIRGCNDFFDFCIGVKKKSDFELLLISPRAGEVREERQQKVCRYYISQDGGKLVKDYGMQDIPVVDKRTGYTYYKRGRKMVSVEASALVTPANRIDDQSVPTNLDHTYYIREANKEIQSVLARTNQLALF